MSRQVTVYESSKNGKVTVLENVEATNLGELKSIMVAKGIDIENMDFMEGVSNIVLRDDNSVLPSHIPYKGDYTDNLFIYLSLKNKKISSGVMSRQEAYQYIKEHNLGETVKKLYGKNFTQVSTSDLLDLIDDVSNEPEAPKSETPSDTLDLETRFKNLRKAFEMLLDTLYEDGNIYSADFNAIKDALKEGEPVIPAKSFFEDDIDNLIPR